MRVLNLYACAILIASVASLAVGQDDTWKGGPGELKLARIGTVSVPDGYDYAVLPNTTEEIMQAHRSPKQNTPVVLGGMRNLRRDLTLSFLYVPVDAPVSNDVMSRLYAWTGLNTAANRVANKLNSQVGVTAKVVANDRYDRRLAAVTFVLSQESAMLGILSRKSLSRYTMFYGRHGLLLAVAAAPDDQFAEAEPELRRIVEGIVVSPDERFHGIYESLGPVPPGGTHLPWYALAGLLIGAGTAVLRKRIGNTQRLRS